MKKDVTEAERALYKPVLCPATRRISRRAQKKKNKKRKMKMKKHAKQFVMCQNEILYHDFMKWCKIVEKCFV